MPEKYRTVIIDDEKLAREIIKKYLHSHPKLEFVCECTNGFEGIKKINEEAPDLVFLDVQMPKITGFEMLELIEKPPVIIFTTAFDHYALKAFEVNAADYLLKPYSLERFNEAVEKAILQVNSKRGNNKVVEGIIEHVSQTTESIEKVIIKDGSTISIIPVDSIIYLEAQDDYVMIYSHEGKHLKQKTMRYFDEHLSKENFIRIHRSYIASIKEIKKIELLAKETYQVILSNGTKLPVSKTGYDRIKEALK